MPHIRRRLKLPLDHRPNLHLKVVRACHCAVIDMWTWWNLDGICPLCDALNTNRLLMDLWIGRALLALAILSPLAMEAGASGSSVTMSTSSSSSARNASTSCTDRGVLPGDARIKTTLRPDPALDSTCALPAIRTKRRLGLAHAQCPSKNRRTTLAVGSAHLTTVMSNSLIAGCWDKKTSPQEKKRKRGTK